MATMDSAKPGGCSWAEPPVREINAAWDEIVRAFSLWEKVPEGRMRGGTSVFFRMFMTCTEVP